MSEKQTEQSPIRKSRFRKGIQRTLNTAKFESIVIHEEIEEEIEWQTLEERQTKKNNWTTVLIQEFQQTHDRILDELGLQHKKAYFKSGLDKDTSDTNDLADLDTLG